MPSLVDLIGAVDNLGEPEPVLNRPAAILGVIISFSVLTWICFLLRFYTRFVIIKSPWWDDLFVFLSITSTTVGGVAVGAMTRAGMGKHIVLLPQDHVRDYLHGFWVANATYPCSTAFIKLALLFQYMRIFERGSKLWIISLALVVFTGIWGLAFGILAWFPTSPVDAYWDLTKPAARYAYGTLDADTFVATYESHAAVNMLLDAIVLAVAVPLFFKRGMKEGSYWGLMTLFIVGGIVNMLSIWRLQSIVETRAATLPTFDPTWYGATPIVLSSMEVNLATVCASLPVFWPVLKKTLSPYIMVTHEVKVTRELRRWEDEDGDNVELRHQTGHSDESGVMQLPGMSEEGGHYRNSFTSKHGMGSPIGSSIGRVTSARSQYDSKDSKELTSVTGMNMAFATHSKEEV